VIQDFRTGSQLLYTPQDELFVSSWWENLSVRRRDRKSNTVFVIVRFCLRAPSGVSTLQHTVHNRTSLFCKQAFNLSKEERLYSSSPQPDP
jgi:hypothetical protein